MEEKSLKTSVAMGVAFAYIRIFVLVVISIVYPAFVIWKVGKIEYGILEYVLSLTESLALLSFGVERAYTHFATKARDEEGEDALAKLNGTFLVLFLGISLLQIIGTVIIALLAFRGVIGGGSYENNVRVLEMILISGATVAIEFLFSLFPCYVLFNQNFTFEHCALMISKILMTCLSILFIGIGLDIRAVVIVNAAVTAVYVIVGILHAKLELKMRFSFKCFKEIRHDLQSIFKFSFFIFTFVLIKEIALVGGKLIMGSIGDDSDVTIMSYAISFLSFAFMMALAISETYRPEINEFAEQKDTNNINLLFRRGVVVSFAIIGGFFAALFLCGKEFIAIWLFESDLSQDEITQIYNIAIFMLGVWVLPLAFFVGLEIQRAFEKHRLFATISFVFALIGLAISILVAALSNKNDPNLVYSPIWGMAIAPLTIFVLSIFYFIFVLKAPVLKVCLNMLMCISALLIGFLPVYFIGEYALTSLSSGPKLFIKFTIFIVLYLPVLYAFFHHDLNHYFAKAHQNHIERHQAHLKHKEKRIKHTSKEQQNQ